MLRSQTQTHRTGREILQCAPHARHYQQPLPGVIQHNLASLLAVIKHHFKRAAYGHKQLAQLLMGMTTTALTTRHVIYPIGTAYIKRHVPTLLRNSQGATRRVNNAGQRHYLAFI